MYTYKLLTDVALEDLHASFLEAFSDYEVPLKLPFWKFKNMLERRSYKSEYSIGAFLNGKLAGFILNGVRCRDGIMTAYDCGTGVVPEHRRKGVTTKLFSRVKELLQENGISRYLLEVIQSNTKAFELYKKSGFKVIREFGCCQAASGEISSASSPEEISISEGDIKSADWDILSSMWDYQPSWQNTCDSILAVPDSFSLVICRDSNMKLGYAVVDRKTGDIPQFAVAGEYRRKGIGTALLSTLPGQTEAENLTFLNIEEGSSELQHFLQKKGFTEIVKQYEMHLELDKEC